MTVLSILRGFKPTGMARNFNNVLVTNSNSNQIALRNFGLTVARKGDHKMVITPSRWSWHQYKDLLHFYIMLGAIPLSILTFLVNIYVGPAKLQEIPPGYKPNHWEYYSHPITRFLARYCFQHPQEAYERNLHYITEEYEARDMRLLDRRAHRLMSERGDYLGSYQKQVNQNKILRAVIKDNDANEFTWRGEPGEAGEAGKTG